MPRSIVCASERHRELLLDILAEEDINEVRIELRALARSDRRNAIAKASRPAVATLVGHSIERVGNRDDSRRIGDAGAGDAVGISGSVPSFVVRNDPRRQIWIECGERGQHGRSARRMGRDRLTLRASEPRALVNNVEQRFMYLADIVEQRDALDLVLRREIGSIRCREDQGIARDTSHV